MFETVSITIPEYKSDGSKTPVYASFNPDIIEMKTYDIKYKPYRTIKDIINSLTNVYDNSKQYYDDMTTSIDKLIEIKKQITTAIKTNKTIKFINDGVYNQNNNQYPFKAIKNYPENIKDKINKQFDILREANKKNAKQHDTFIKENVEELFNEIDNHIIDLQNKLKESRKNANKKYYEKQKALMNTIKKPSKTPEEILEARKEANHKFYLKRKEMLKDFKYIPKTDEEKLEAKKEANKKYYEKKKLQKQESEN